MVISGLHCWESVLFLTFHFHSGFLASVMDDGRWTTAMDGECVQSVFLVCLAGVFLRKACSWWMLQCCNEFGKTRESEGHCDPLWMSQREKGNHSRFPATEQGIRGILLGWLDLGNRSRAVDQPSAYWLFWEEYHRVSRGCLLCLGAGEMHRVIGGQSEGKELLHSQRMGTRGQERLPWVFCCRSGNETERTDLEEEREKRSSVSLPV